MATFMLSINHFNEYKKASYHPAKGKGIKNDSPRLGMGAVSCEANGTLVLGGTEDTLQAPGKSSLMELWQKQSLSSP